MSVTEKSCNSESTSPEECTIYGVIRKNSFVQKMKLLFLQDVIINGNDICITRIVNEKKLIEILEKNHSVEIWARKAENKMLVINGIDKKEISHLSVEEEFFIECFDPELNKNKTEK